jgi:CubicO group peptidase (beta-lactamase class C family)
VNVGEYLERITPFGFSGSCLFGVGDDVVSNRGYGLAIRGAGMENTADTVFSLGSVTKQFTAAAILKLEEDGALRTDDAVGRFLAAPPDRAAITLHQLLTHTSGLAAYTGEDYEPAGRDETVARALESQLRFPPGSDFAYSNAGYSVLAAIVELVSDIAYEEFLSSRLFDPAGLRSTGYRLPDWSTAVVAHWYAGESDHGSPLDKPYPSWNLIGNGDMLSTTEDMWRWHRALRNGAVLSGPSLAKMWTPYARGYGYGWKIVEDDRGRVVEHGGASTYGTSCAVKRFVDADAFLVLYCNASYGASPLAEVVQDRVVAAAFAEAVPVPPRAEACRGEGRAAGDYRLPSGGRLRLTGGGITAEGQDAVDELAFGGASHAPLNGRALRLVSSVRAGDEAPLRSEVAGDAERLERYRRMIGEYVGDVQVVGTLPSHLRGVPVTHVRIGDEALAFYWRDGKLLGLGEGLREAAYEVPLARSDEGLVAFNLQSESLVKITVDDGSLTLVTADRAVRAERV